MLLCFENVSFFYEKNGNIIDNLNFELKEGELAVIEGKSGSGKSTFLHMAGLLSFPQSGKITFMDKDVSKYKKKHELRRSIGHIFQSHMLWKDLSAKENVAMPLVLQGISRSNAHKIAEEWLCKVGLENYINSSITKISGGEQQRVGLARAFAHNPKLILADEPTGNLDEETGDKIMHICIQIARKNNISMICVTHNKKWNNMFDSEYYFEKGKLHIVRRNDV
ncbi:ABC transporter ATP-binding protein [Candidatus Cytomitobacter indipagum]|uniref:ABC transporter ATP-binding protein n=1 Tax=Candidatus Cytomitobacter indipagum TaxID=2601575 RepID=A0A5C0UF29_9PROT|nr:ABC transporter ATP-binding protein [Candidatus Cytomitobacter indipagum]QEK37872.1 ABC transporter ATP-binding protein [Candidatus Cytomitobacter indipagum]